MADPRAEIEETVNRETRAWDAQDVDLLMTVWHPDMVWPWPGDQKSIDPMEWNLDLGRYDSARWRKGWQDIFDSTELVHNRRSIQKIVVFAEGDGARALVDIDTLWRNESGAPDHWLGRTCKIYTRVRDEWKMITQLGTFVADSH